MMIHDMALTSYFKRDRMNEKLPEDKKVRLFSIARLKLSVINISLELACYILTPLPSFLSKYSLNFTQTLPL